MNEQMHFRWTVSYLGCVEYEVWGDGAPYRVEVRREASAYERAAFNGTDAEWQRDVEGAIGLIRRVPDCDRPISPHVVDAFNAWRSAEHETFVERLRSRPERYGNIAPNDPLLVPPPVVRGAHYEVGKGWVVNADDPTPAEVIEIAITPQVGELRPRG